MIGILSLANNNKDYYIDLLLSISKFKDKSIIRITTLIDEYIKENTQLDVEFKNDIYKLPYDEVVESLTVFFNEKFNRIFNEDLFQEELRNKSMLFIDKDNDLKHKIIITTYRKYKSFIINFIKNNYDKNFFTSILKEFKEDDSIVVTDIKTKDEMNLCDELIILIPLNQKNKLKNNDKHLNTDDEIAIEHLFNDIIDRISTNEDKIDKTLYLELDNKDKCIIINTNINKKSIIEDLEKKVK